MREKIQKEASDTILLNRDGIIFCSLRLGKTRIGLLAIEESESVLICYPTKTILNSWQDELLKFIPKSTNITFVCNSSLKKYKDSTFDYLIIDEPQMASNRQLGYLKTIKYRKRVGLSGTLNTKTLKRLKEILNLEVKYNYHLEDAIKHNLVKDYEVSLAFIELDNINRNIIYKKYGKEILGTEKEVYESYSQTMDYFNNQFVQTGNLKSSLGYKKYMNLRTNFLYNSNSLFVNVKNYIDRNIGNKCLIYTLRTEIANKLSKKVYHSKDRNDKSLEDFKESKEGHLCVINCVNAGITIKNLNKVIFHTTESSEEKFTQKLGRSLLYEFNKEKSKIIIFVLKNTQMETWVNKSIKLLNESKIKYIFNGNHYSKIEWIKFNNPGKQLFYYNDSICYKEKDELYYFIDNPIKGYNLDKSKITYIN